MKTVVSVIAISAMFLAVVFAGWMLGEVLFPPQNPKEQVTYTVHDMTSDTTYNCVRAWVTTNSGRAYCDFGGGEEIYLPSVNQVKITKTVKRLQ